MRNTAVPPVVTTTPAEPATLAAGRRNPTAVSPARGVHLFRARPIPAARGSARRAYSVGMVLPGSVPIVGVMVALGVPVLAPAPSPPVDAVPVLTSTPFGAGPGQQVTHTITVSGSGTGTVAAVRVTFTTTVDLDGAAANASPGSCAVTARTVVCDLGDLRFPPDAATPTITITGTVHLGAAPGALVQNRVSVHSAQSGTNPADDVVSNAYLLPGSSAKPTGQPTGGAYVAAARSARRPTSRAPAVAAVLACGTVALGGLLLFRRLRQRRS